MADKAKGLALLLGMPKGGAGDDDDESPDSEMDMHGDRMQSAAKGFLAAVAGKDADGLATAFHEMWEACEAKYGSEEEPEEV